MRLLIVNPNTSEGVTARIAAAAQAVAHPGDVFTTRTAAFGPRLIVTADDNERAAGGVLATVRAHSGPEEHSLDGIVLASFGDTGARLVRAAYPGLPVVGIAGAAYAAARVMGDRVGVVTFGHRLVPTMREMAEAHGLGDRLMGIAALPDTSAPDPETVQSRSAAALEALAREMVEAGADTIVLGGGPLAGLASEIGRCLSVPVIDGVQAAIGLIRSAVAEDKSRSDRRMTTATP